MSSMELIKKLRQDDLSEKGTEKSSAARLAVATGVKPAEAQRGHDATRRNNIRAPARTLSLAAGLTTGVNRGLADLTVVSLARCF